MKRPRSKVSTKLCKMQNSQVFSWMKNQLLWPTALSVPVCSTIVGASVVPTNQPTKMVSGFQGSSTLSLVIHSNILDLYLKYSLFWVKSMHTFKLCGDSYQFLNINFWVRPLYIASVGARGVLKAEPYLAIHSIDCLLQKVITQVSPIYSPAWFVLPITPDRPRV